MENGIFLASISWLILSVNSNAANSVEWSLRNPYWLSHSRPLDVKYSYSWLNATHSKIFDMEDSNDIGR